jgi:hypothetical protein
MALIGVTARPAGSAVRLIPGVLAISAAAALAGAFVVPQSPVVLLALIAAVYLVHVVWSTTTLRMRRPATAGRRRTVFDPLTSRCLCSVRAIRPQHPDEEHLR